MFIWKKITFQLVDYINDAANDGENQAADTDI